MMPTDDPSLTAFLDLDAPGEPAFVFDGTAISRAELSGARMLIMQSSFRSTDFAAILSGIEKAAVPGLARVAVVGSAQFRCAWPSLHFDPFDRRYPPAPVRPENIDAPLLLYTTSKA